MGTVGYRFERNEVNASVRGVRFVESRRTRAMTDAGRVQDVAQPTREELRMLQTARLTKNPARRAAGSAYGVTSGYEGDLWAMTDALRGAMDVAEYKHLVLGLIFLKYISDTFEDRYKEVLKERGAEAAENRDAYVAEDIFWIPQEARWSLLRSTARQPPTGQSVDEAMVVIERDNPTLKGVLPRGYARPAFDNERLGRLIDLISEIKGGDKGTYSRDILGRIYEYFLAQFARAEGKKGGEFYTPICVVRLMVEMIEPYRGRVYDPCCGSSGMFVQSIKFSNAHAGGDGNSVSVQNDISIHGQESNYTTWRLAKMNLIIRGIDGRIEFGDSFLKDLQPALMADFILANPPFNDSEWGGDRLTNDKRWRYGVPPKSNANFAWIQHMIHHLAPSGIAGLVLTYSSMYSGNLAETAIRKSLIDADLVECVMALPGQLFYSTQVPACVWFLARNRKRRGEVLFIDARKCGRMSGRIHRELTDEDIARIVGAFRVWRGRLGKVSVPQIPGFCTSATTEEIRRCGYVVAPWRYVATEPQKGGGEPFEAKIQRLVAELRIQRAEAAELDDAIASNLEALGCGLKEDSH